MSNRDFSRCFLHSYFYENQFPEKKKKKTRWEIIDRYLATWYNITYTGEQVAQWDFQNKGRCDSRCMTGTSDTFKNLFIRVVVGTARIFTLAKQSVDCMIEKLSILKRSPVPAMHLLSQTTSRQLVAT